MNPDFYNLLELLKKSNVDFILIGGFAGVVYGSTMVTQDIDLCCDFSKDNLLKLQKALSSLHPTHRQTPKRIPLELNENNCETFKNLYLDTDLGQLDCVSSVLGLGDYHKVLAQSQIVTDGNIQYRVLTIDSLIESKKALGRPRDKQAVTELEAIRKLKNNSQESQE